MEHTVHEQERDGTHLRLGSDLLTTAQVAERYRVTERTVERWIARGLPAIKATQEQIGYLISLKLLQGWPPTGVWLIREADLPLLATIRRPAGRPATKQPKGNRG